MNPMDPELYLLYQTQLCLLLGQRVIIDQNVLLGAGQREKVALMTARLDAQIKRLREKGVSLDA